LNATEQVLASLVRPGSGGVDRLRRYLQRVRPAFDAAQESAARLAGLLITAEMRQSRHVLDLGSRTAGLQCLADARASLSEAAVPERAAHFHHHLSQAVALLDGAWRATEDQRAGLVAAGDPLPQLQAAWEEIKFASRAMPGFETVDFRNSCCAMHRNKSGPADKGEEDVGLFDLDT
jgi:hypothetical protein